MRIWSLHPKYLDAKGLVALWRETLLAKHVLEGRTKGYKNHPQLKRFKVLDNPVDSVNQYLSDVYYEAQDRGYNFTKEKVFWDFKPTQLSVTSGQLKYEFEHLLRKLKIRDENRFKEIQEIVIPQVHPMFEIIEGEIEDWEIVT